MSSEGKVTSTQSFDFIRQKDLGKKRGILIVMLKSTYRFILIEK